MQVLAPCLTGLPLGEAIAVPRVRASRHGRADPDQFERDPAVAEAVANWGLPGHEHEPQAMFFGGVGGAARNATSAVCRGRPRREAATGVA